MKHLAAAVNHLTAKLGGVGYVAVVRERARKAGMNRFYGLRVFHGVVARGGIAHVPHGYVRARNVAQKVAKHVVHKPYVFMAYESVVAVKRGYARSLLTAVLKR